MSGELDEKAVRAYLAASPSPSEMEVVAWTSETMLEEMRDPQTVCGTIWPNGEHVSVGLVTLASAHSSLAAMRAERDVMHKRISNQRNLNLHAEALLAMSIWGHEYAQQNGGCMDFWDSLSPSIKALCASLLDDIHEAERTAGRAALEGIKSK